MNYYLDTEFIECAKQRTLLGFKIGQPVPTIDLISIGIVSEDGREFFALNAECELEYAWANKWVRENVLGKIYEKYFHGDARNTSHFSLRTMRRLFRAKGLSKEELRSGITRFVGFYEHMRCPGIPASVVFRHHLKEQYLPKFYGYYADYDWVVICQLFGRMIDLPKGFPMFCLDLKQILDSKAAGIRNHTIATQPHVDVASFETYLNCIKKNPGYPVVSEEHDALADAKWNRSLHNFINTLA